MSGFSDYWARKIIDHTVGRTAIDALSAAYVALYTAPPTDAGGGTEVTGGSYARKATVAADWNAAAGSAPSSNSNANPLAFPQATADWAPPATPVYAWSLMDAASAGNMRLWDYLGNFPWNPCIAAAGDLASDLLTSPAHGLVANDPVVFSAEFGGGVPTGLTAGALYYVIAAGLTTDQFKVSAAMGGAAVDITAVGRCMVRKVQTKIIQAGDTPSFAVGQLSVYLA